MTSSMSSVWNRYALSELAKQQEQDPVTSPTSTAGQAQPSLSGNYVNSLSDVREKYGYNTQGITVDPEKPDEGAAEITRQKMGFYERFYEPLLSENSQQRMQDTSLVSEARANANKGFRNLAQRNVRQRRRYNMYGGRPAAVLQNTRAQDLQERSLNFDNSVNTARMDLQDRNTAFRDEMINIFNGIDSSSQQGLASAVANQKQRDSAYAQAKASHKAQQYNTIGTAAMITAMFL